MTNSIKMIIVPSPRGPRCCHRSENRDDPCFLCVCVSLKYFHQGSPKNSIYTVYQIIPKVFSRWRGATSNIYRTISYIRSSFAFAYARQIKVHSSTFRILRDTHCIEYGPLWYCLVGNRLSFFVAIFGFNYRTLLPRSSDNGEDGQLIISSQGEEKATSGVLEGCQLMRMETYCPLFSVLQKNNSWSCS